MISIVFASSPPTLWERVLDVHAADGHSSMTIEIEFVGTISVVAFVGLGIPVGVPESPPSAFVFATIGEYRFGSKKRVHCFLEFSAFFAFQRLRVLYELSAVDGVGGRQATQKKCSHEKVMS